MAVSYDRIARDIAFTLEVKSPKIAENLFRSNAVLALMGMGNRTKIVRGGNRFDERTRLGANSNVGHRSKFAEIPTAMQDNVQTAYYGHAVCSGAAVVNLVEQDQNAGSSRIESISADALNELMLSMPNEIANQLMASSSTSTTPTSIVEELEATAYGSQTRSTGGIARSSYPGTTAQSAWQTQYNSTAADLAAATGIATFTKFLWTCSPGGAAITEQPDIGLTRSGVLAEMAGGADVLRRFGTNDRLAALGFDNFRINRCALIADATLNEGSLSGYCYVLNTNYARIQILAGQNTKETGEVTVIGDGKTPVPLQVCNPVESDNVLQYVIKAYIVYNLTFSSLRQHGLKTGLTEAT